MKHFAAAAVLALPVLLAAQQQVAKPRGDWPCGARVDPTYFDMAEATGGHLLLLAPEEIGDSAMLLIAFDAHPQTIFRLAGSLKAGLHEFQLPIDSSVESVVFSISVQCLQVADVIGPSGTSPGGDNVTDLASFRAQRMVIVKRPEPGVWTLRVSGSGIAGILVQAKSAIGMSHPEFASPDSQTFTHSPTAGAESVMRIHVNGNVSEVQGSVINAAAVPIAKLRWQAESEGSFVSRLTPGADAFRVVIVGKDSEGFPFQRMDSRLTTPTR